MMYPTFLHGFIGFILHITVIADFYDSFHIYYCKRFSGTCEAYTKLIHANKQPICYCDVNCELFNDCCYDFLTTERDDSGKQKNKMQDILSNSSGNISQTFEDFKLSNENKSDASQRNTLEIQKKIRLREQVPIYAMDTCLMINNDVTGFWVVNKCPKTGRQCSEGTEMRDVLRHVPVTDQQNVTYFGADCAICNNITTFTAWGIHVKTNVKNLQNDINLLSLIEDIDETTFQSTLEQIGKIELISPPSVSHRLCHNFSTKAKNIASEVCPDYQCTTVQKNFNKVEAIFRNPECCILLAEDGCQKNNILIGLTRMKHVVSLHDVTKEIGWGDSLYIRVFIRPGSIHQPCKVFENKKTSWTANSTFYMYNQSCLQSKFEVFKYPLRDRYLTFTTMGQYDAKMILTAFDMAFTYFWRTKWKIQLGDIIPVYHSKNGQCYADSKMCTVVEFPLRPLSATNLTIQQIHVLEAWLKNMSFTFLINTSSYHGEVSGIMSHNSTHISNCFCNDGGLTEKDEIRQKFSFFTPLHTEWKSINNDCVDHRLVLNSVKDLEIDEHVAVLEVYCKQEEVDRNAAFAATFKLYISVILLLNTIKTI